MDTFFNDLLEILWVIASIILVVYTIRYIKRERGNVNSKKTRLQIQDTQTEIQNTAPAGNIIEDIRARKIYFAAKEKERGSKIASIKCYPARRENEASSYHVYYQDGTDKIVRIEDREVSKLLSEIAERKKASINEIVAGELGRKMFNETINWWSTPLKRSADLKLIYGYPSSENVQKYMQTIANISKIEKRIEKQVKSTSECEALVEKYLPSSSGDKGTPWFIESANNKMKELEEERKELINEASAFDFFDDSVLAETWFKDAVTKGQIKEPLIDFSFRTPCKIKRIKVNEKDQDCVGWITITTDSNQKGYIIEVYELDNLYSVDYGDHAIVEATLTKIEGDTVSFRLQKIYRVYPIENANERMSVLSEFGGNNRYSMNNMEHDEQNKRWVRYINND